MPQSLQERIAAAKKLGAERNYFKYYQRGVCDVVQFTEKVGETGRSIIVKFKIVESQALRENAEVDKPGSVVACVWKPDDSNKIKAELALRNAVTLISEALGGEVEVDAETVSEVKDERQFLRGFRLNFSVTPNPNKPEGNQYPRFKAHPDNTPESVAARRKSLDVTDPVDFPR